MKIISVSQANSPEPWRNTYFDPHAIDSSSDLCEIITKKVWSPILWKDGQRKGDQFLFSDFLVLDYDEGLSIKDAISMFKDDLGAKFILGTTKSHQKEKNGKPPCDRFRVIIPWHERLSVSAVYLQNMYKITAKLQTDVACKDLARHYQPCTDIVMISDGLPMKWHPYRPRPRLQYGHQRSIKNGEIPGYIMAWLKATPEPGRRNAELYKAAYALKHYVSDENEFLDLIMGSNTDLPDLEKKQIARSAWAAPNRP